MAPKRQSARSAKPKPARGAKKQKTEELWLAVESESSDGSEVVEEQHGQTSQQSNPIEPEHINQSTGSKVKKVLDTASGSQTGGETSQARSTKSSVAAFGTDLGTTNTCAGFHRNGNIEFVNPTGSDSQTFSSDVYIKFESGSSPPPLLVDENELEQVLHENPKVLIGEQAKEASRRHPENYLKEWKFLIGRDYASPAVQDMIRKHSLSNLVEAEDGGVNYMIEGRRVSPRVAAALVLAELKRLVAEKVGCPVDNVVIGIPAMFGERARSDTAKAAVLAGLKPLRLVNEPTALGYYRIVTSDDNEAYYLILDMGGSTFDVSLMLRDSVDGTAQVIQVRGDNNLGGKDFTQAVFRTILTEYFKPKGKTKVYPRGTDLLSLESAAEALKLEFSDTPRDHNTLFKCQPVVNGHQANYTIRRSNILEAIYDLLERIKAPILEIKSSVKRDWESVHKVLLMGGGCRLPEVVETIKEVIDDKELIVEDHETGVARGLILYAAHLTKDPTLKNDVALELLDVAPYHYGILTHTNQIEAIFTKGCALPAMTETEFYFPKDMVNGGHKREVDFEVYEYTNAENPHADKKRVGTAVFKRQPLRDNLPMSKIDITTHPDYQKIDATFHLNEDSRVSICAEVKIANERLEMELRREISDNHASTVQSTSNPRPPASSNSPPPSKSSSKQTSSQSTVTRNQAGDKVISSSKQNYLDQIAEWSD